MTSQQKWTAWRQAFELERTNYRYTRQTQSQLDFMSEWCSQRSMGMNTKKSQIVHVHHHQKKREIKKLYCCGQELMYVATYKYLGYHIHEHLKNTKTTEILTASAKRAFGSIINMFKHLGNMGYKTYTTLYNSNILSIANYAGGVWGFQEYNNTRVLQNKAIRLTSLRHWLQFTERWVGWILNLHVGWISYA